MADNPYTNKVVFGDETLIDLTSDTVSAESLAEGETAHDASGSTIVGTASVTTKPTADDAGKVWTAGSDGTASWKEIPPVDSTLTQGGQAADAAEVGNRLSALSEEIKNVGATTSAQGIVRSSDTRIIGEIFEKPDVYTAWPLGNVQYDKDTQRVVMAINSKPAHTTGIGKVYFTIMDPVTYDVSEPTVMAEDDSGTYGCLTQSLCVLNNGTYMCVVRVHTSSNVDDIQEVRKYVSTDKGETWTYTTDLAFGDGSLLSEKSYWKSVTAMIQLSNGRLLASVGTAIIYSDDNGATWTESTTNGASETFLLELSDGKILAIGRKSWTLGATTAPAIFFTSSDYGTTWTAPADSASITDMSGNPCFGVYYSDEKLVELFYCSRSSSSGDGAHYGTIYSKVATEDDAFTDRFGAAKVLGYSKMTELGINFGYMAGAKDARNGVHLFYYDVDSTGVNWNYIRADRYVVQSIPQNDGLTSEYTGWSSAKIFEVINALNTQLTTKINYLALTVGAEAPDEIGYVKDGLVFMFHSMDYEEGSTTCKTHGDLNAGNITVKHPELITKVGDKMVLSGGYYKGVATLSIDYTVFNGLMTNNSYEAEFAFANPVTSSNGSLSGIFESASPWHGVGVNYSGVTVYLTNDRKDLKIDWSEFADSVVYVSVIYDGTSQIIKINDEIMYEAAQASLQLPASNINMSLCNQNGTYCTFGTFRFYNRVLTNEERAMNRALDKSYFEN